MPFISGPCNFLYTFDEETQSCFMYTPGPGNDIYDVRKCFYLTFLTFYQRKYWKMSSKGYKAFSVGFGGIFTLNAKHQTYDFFFVFSPFWGDSSPKARASEYYTVSTNILKSHYWVSCDIFTRGHLLIIFLKHSMDPGDFEKL